MLDQNMRLSVIVPAYNEGNWILNNLQEISRTIESFAPNYEIIAVNDGSVDNTWEQMQLAAIEDEHIRVNNLHSNAGKGRALCMGTAMATGHLIAFCDADLDLHPRQLERFMKTMDTEQCDAVIGSKMHPDSCVEYPWYRYIVSWGYYWLLMILFRLNVKDTQTGLKLFRADVIKPVMEQILVKRFAFDIEVLAILNSRRYRIISVPITIVFQRKGMNSRIKFTDIVYTAQDTLAIFYRLKILNYYDKKMKDSIMHKV